MGSRSQPKSDTDSRADFPIRCPYLRCRVQDGPAVRACETASARVHRRSQQRINCRFSDITSSTRALSGDSSQRGGTPSAIGRLPIGTRPVGRDGGAVVPDLGRDAAGAGACNLVRKKRGRRRASISILGKSMRSSPKGADFAAGSQAKMISGSGKDRRNIRIGSPIGERN